MSRLDSELVSRGLAESRTKAQRMIEEGAVTVNGKCITKASFSIAADAVIGLQESTASCRYVGRGGLKLEAALGAFGVSVADKVCLDIGASTGGFTDCLLQNGASHVYAVDSGRDQLSPRLCSDPRVTSMEGRNARLLAPSDFGVQPTVAVMDVSFISQTLILPAIAGILPPKGILISLIKPQFEVGRAGVGKNGIVKSEDLRRSAVKRVCESAAACGLTVKKTITSPITGGDGNVEYLSLFVHEQETT